MLPSWGFGLLVAFLRTNDAFVQLLSLCMTIAYLVGVSGRNFGSSRLVLAQILCAEIPTMAAVLSAQNTYYTLFALVLLLPFFVSLKFISDRLRRTLLDAVIAQPRHVAACQALRYCSEQHAARPLHV